MIELTILLREQATNSNLLMNIKTTTERWKTKKRRKERQQRQAEQQREWEERFKQWYEYQNQQRRYGGEYGGYTGYNNEQTYVNPTIEFKKKYEESCDLLGVGYDADKYEIKLSYRKKSKTISPRSK